MLLMSLPHSGIWGGWSGGHATYIIASLNDWEFAWGWEGVMLLTSLPDATTSGLVGGREGSCYLHHCHSGFGWTGGDGPFYLHHQLSRPFQGWLEGWGGAMLLTSSLGSAIWGLVGGVGRGQWCVITSSCSWHKDIYATLWAYLLLHLHPNMMPR